MNSIFADTSATLSSSPCRSTAGREVKASQHSRRVQMHQSFAQQIAAHRAHLQQLRAQRPFRQVAKAGNVISINARRERNMLLQVGSAA